MYFLTNFLKESGVNDREPGKEFKFHFQCGVENPASSEIFYCVKIQEDGSKLEVSPEDFFNSLKQDPCKNILFYIHGFNTLPERTLEDAKKLQNFLDDINYQLVPIVWPSAKSSHSENEIKDLPIEQIISHKVMRFQKIYQSDREKAEISYQPFTKFISDFVHWKKEQNPDSEEFKLSKNISILAHSAGCRMLTYSMYNVLKNFSKEENPPQVFDNIFLVAPELDYDELEKGKPGYSLAGLAKNFYLYFALNDIALTMSLIGKEYEFTNDDEKDLIQRFFDSAGEYMKLGLNIKDNAKVFSHFLKGNKHCQKSKFIDLLLPLLTLLKSKPHELLIMASSVIRIKNAKPSLGQVALKGMCTEHGSLVPSCSIPAANPDNLKLVNCTGLNIINDKKLGHIYHREKDIYDPEASFCSGKIFENIKEKLNQDYSSEHRMETLSNESSLLFRTLSRFMDKAFKH